MTHDDHWNRLSWCAATVLCALSLLRCGGDSDEEGQAQGGSGGSSGTGGTGGNSPTGGSGGSAAAGAGGSTEVDAGADAGSDADAAAGSNLLALVAGTDFATSNTEVSTIDVRRGMVVGRTTVADSDAIPVASDHRGFVLERTNGVLHVLSSTGTIEHSLSLSSGDGGSYVNPHTVVVVPSSQGAKGYVSLYEGNAIVVVNVDTGAELSRIDLTAYLDAADADGSVDVDGGFYDPAKNIVYFALQRVDRNTIVAPVNELACPAVPSLLVGIDPTTDTLVDINGSTAGEAVELSLVEPASIAFDAANDRALLLDNGCFDSGVRVRHGIETVNLTSGATSVLYDPTSQDFLNRLLAFEDGKIGVESFDLNYQTQLQLFQPSTSSLGAALPGIPEFPVAETADTLLGVGSTPIGGDTRADLVRYAISTSMTTTVASAIFDGNFEFVAGVALVKP